ncbi:hypothetical protein ACJX0J_025176, partial [Zea mays]
MSGNLELLLLKVIKLDGTCKKQALHPFDENGTSSMQEVCHVSCFLLGAKKNKQKGSILFLELLSCCTIRSEVALSSFASTIIFQICLPRAASNSFCVLYVLNQSVNFYVKPILLDYLLFNNSVRISSSLETSLLCTIFLSLFLLLIIYHPERFNFKYLDALEGFAKGFPGFYHRSVESSILTWHVPTLVFNYLHHVVWHIHLSAALIIGSEGVPMFYMGDEYGHTKGGNNNTFRAKLMMIEKEYTVAVFLNLIAPKYFTHLFCVLPQPR